MNPSRGRRRLHRLATALTAAAALLLAGCGGSGGSGGEPSVTMNLGHVFPDGSEIDNAADAFAEDVAERTNGTVTINVFPGGQLGGDEELATALNGGTLEAAVLSIGSSGFGDRVQLQNLPYLVDSYEAADELFYGDGFMAEWDRETMRQNGIVALAFVENGFRALSNSVRPVATPADVAGLKIRAPSSDAVIDILSLWGAQPTAIPFPELYTALQQGTVDGQENGVTLFHDAKLYEVQPYFTNTRYMYATAAFTVSQGVWDRLSPNQQEVLQSAAEQASLAQREAARSSIADAIADLKTKIEVTELTDEQFALWRQSVEPIYDQARQRFGDEVINDLVAAAEAAKAAARAAEAGDAEAEPEVGDSAAEVGGS